MSHWALGGKGQHTQTRKSGRTFVQELSPSRGGKMGPPMEEGFPGDSVYGYVSLGTGGRICVNCHNPV